MYSSPIAKNEIAVVMAEVVAEAAALRICSGMLGSRTKSTPMVEM
jgi:hypothetical protein